MTLSITGVLREERGRKTNHLRAEGQVPAVLYGFEVEPSSIQLDRNELERLYKQAGVSTVIDLSVDGAVHNVLIQELQRDPVSEDIIHADFRRIDMTEKVEASISLKFVGEAPAVKEQGGVFMRSADEVQVLALPVALVREIEVDLGKLATFDDVIRVSDIVVPEGIEILSDQDSAIASVQAPRTQEEMDALDDDIVADVESVEVATEKKEEDEGEAEASAE